MIQGALNASAAEIMTLETPIRPEYERPPLVEKAISVAFQPVAGFTIVHYGLFWQRISKQFPHVTNEAPLNTTVETFDEVRSPRLDFELLEVPPVPRAIFRSGRGEIVQIQSDRFAFNWARESGGDYPHSEAVMASFNDIFRLFVDFVAEEEIGPINLTQCEITNVNVIPVSDFGGGYEDMVRAFKVDDLDLGLPFLRPETYIRRRQHRIVREDGSPIGRLHTVISPVVSNEDQSKAFRLELTARSAPGVNTVEQAQWFFGVARNAINGAFQAITTPEVRSRWGERHG